VNELAIFAGAGGGILGGHLLGWRTVCAVERDAYAAQVLAQRQNDGALPPFPIWSDVRSFDGRPWRGIVDVVSGGFPCQDISAAGGGAGIDGERSGLWREMARIISEVRCASVLLENSPLLVGRGLAVVLGDLTRLGYDARWCCISAADCGAPHKRDRIWLVAHANGAWQSQPAGQQQERRMGPEQCRQTVDITPPQTHRVPSSFLTDGPYVANTRGEHGERIITQRPDPQIRREPHPGSPGPRRHGLRPWPAEPGVGRVADGLAHRLDRLKALGNGQVPRVAATAFNFLHNNPKQEGSMMDRLKQLAVQANDITCSGPVIHPACPAPYRLFMAAATPAAIINLYERLEASEQIAEHARTIHKLVDRIALGVEEKVRLVHEALATAKNMPDFRSDKEGS